MLMRGVIWALKSIGKAVQSSIASVRAVSKNLFIKFKVLKVDNLHFG